MVSKRDALDALAAKIRRSRKCPLSGRGKAVPGEGPANATVFFVGQAPGAEEAKTGRPFVGRAGKFLDKLLKGIGLARDKVFLTSPEKHFPPGHRLPTQKELDACFPWLVKQISIVNPKVVVLLGNFAEKVLKGHPVLKGRIVLKTVHPSAAMRFTKIRQRALKDFKQLKLVLQKLR